MKGFLCNAKEKFPILVSIVAMLVWFGLVHGIQALEILLYNHIPALNQAVTSSNYLALLLSEIFVVAIGVGAMCLFGYKKAFVEHKEGFFKGLVPGMYILVASVISAISSIAMNKSDTFQPVTQMIIFALTMACVGMGEEFMFRGFISNMIYDKYAKDRSGVWFSVIMTGLVFGLMHMSNALSGATFIGVLVQVVLAGVEGAFLTVIYYRTKNIWTVAFLHGIMDFSALLGTGLFVSESDVVSVIGSYRPYNFMGMLPWVGFLFLICRNSKIRQMLGKTDNKSEPSSNKRLAITAGIVGGILVICLAVGFVDYVRFIYETIQTQMENVDCNSLMLLLSQK